MIRKNGTWRRNNSEGRKRKKRRRKGKNNREEKLNKLYKTRIQGLVANHLRQVSHSQWAVARLSLLKVLNKV